MNETTLRILTVDDHPLVRQGINSIVTSEPGMSVVAEASTGYEGVELFRKHKPDVTLMDLRLPDMSGIDALAAIRMEFRDARIVILTTFEGDVEVQRALRAGASGYVLKSMWRKELVEMIRRVAGGGKVVDPEMAVQMSGYLGDQMLTEREIEVLERIPAGMRNRDIADQLFISEETVKVHVGHILEKLGASDRTQAVTIAVRRGIIRL
jgi:DNA-binding NarL/FixJ family response regulator